MSLLALILAGYGAVAVGLWRWIGRWFADDTPTTDWEDLFFLIVFTTLVSALWGVWIIPRLIRKLADDDSTRVERILIGESRKAKAKRQAERIAALEKELELR